MDVGGRADLSLGRLSRLNKGAAAMTGLLHKIDLDLGGIDDDLSDFTDCFGAVEIHRIIGIEQAFDGVKKVVTQIFYLVFWHVNSVSF